MPSARASGLRSPLTIPGCTKVDDHLHNHGFLHTHHGQWRLAPAFDLNPFPERVGELKTWISEDTGPDASIEALLSVIPYFRLPLSRAKQILRELEQAISRWRETGHALGMTNRDLETFTEAFEHSEREVTRRVVQRVPPTPAPSVPRSKPH